MAGVKGKSGVYKRTEANRTGFKKGHPSYVSTPEVREKLRLSHLGKENHFFGKKHTEKTKSLIGMKNKGNPSWNKNKRTPEQTGEKHVRWKGDKVGYVALHSWVSRWKGKPSLCEMCGNTTAKKFEWANVDHKYRRVLDDYIRLCTKCHTNYDRK